MPPMALDCDAWALSGSQSQWLWKSNKSLWALPQPRGLASKAMRLFRERAKIDFYRDYKCHPQI